MTQRRPLGLTMISAALLAGTFAAMPAHAAGNYPITPDQRQTAQQVAQVVLTLDRLAQDALRLTGRQVARTYPNGAQPFCFT